MLRVLLHVLLLMVCSVGCLGGGPGSGGHRCHMRGCEDYAAEAFSRPSSLHDYTPAGFCDAHRHMIAHDLRGPSVPWAADKIMNFVQELAPEQLVFVRRFGRPHLRGATS